MRMFRTQALTLCCLAIMISSCVYNRTKSDNSILPVPTVTQPSISETIPLETSWLRSDSCKLPCYESLVPGRTTLGEAYDYLSSDPRVRLLSLSTWTDQNSSAISWEWKDTSSQVEIFFTGVESSSIISLIRPILSKPLVLSDVVSVLTEPTELLIDAGKGAEINSPVLSAVTFVYLDKGIALYTKAASAPDVPEISPKTEITMVEIFEPGLSGYRKATGMTIQLPKLLVKWQGYRPFKDYCKQVYAEVDRCV